MSWERIAVPKMVKTTSLLNIPALKKRLAERSAFDERAKPKFVRQLTQPQPVTALSYKMDDAHFEREASFVVPRNGEPDVDVGDDTPFEREALYPVPRKREPDPDAARNDVFCRSYAVW